VAGASGADGLVLPLPGGRARLIGVVAAVLVVAVLAALNLSGALDAQRIEDILVRHPALAPAAYIAVHAIAAAAFVPCSPLTLLAGFLWGPYTGLAYSIAGALAAACFTFMLSRTVLRTAFRNYLEHPVVAGVIGTLNRHEWRLVALAQLNPVVPASSLGYLFGLSTIPFGQFLAASFVFMLPLQIALVSFGVSTRHALFAGDFAGFGAWFLLGAVVLLVFLLIKPALRALAKRGDENA